MDSETTRARADGDVEEGRNEVRLVGRVSQAPEERELPSGDSVLLFRLVVARTGDLRGSRQRVDVLDCAVWGGRVRAAARAWCAGDVVELSGAVRRRFFRAGAGPASRYEIEVLSGRRVRRAARG
ncbi:single-stranded DNA-binding protein [Nocardioides sp. dk4132]|uniref:single-stranded DNA-binding protein n=1 Tax=unclassified Nocardioides TaxID=2615069 RepID=UPI0012957518|nr:MULTISPECIES: single-stranded DNA-binding protein [unclassified Nocardioides]MQW75356.1 single-stranded DNA-binding protein [Nocardioides sp. dk4132]QGA07499.1 single-stranded DNA-binding protein [Nocardioides sp. dk884]